MEISLKDAETAMMNAHNAGDTASAKVMADYITNLKQKTEKKDISRPQAALSSYVRNIPFGTDIAAGIAAPVTVLGGGGVPLGEAYKMAKESFMEDVKLGQEKYPYTSGAAGLTSAIASGLAVPANYYQGASYLSSALKGGAIGAGFGFGYGAQEGENVSERIGSGIYNAAVAAPFGAGGSVAADLLSGGSGAVQRKAAEIANRRVQPIQATVPTVSSGQSGGDDLLRAVKPALTQEIQPLQAGQQIPLSQGQLTQNARLQALQSGAERNVYGEEARNLALKAREVQSDAAKKALSNIAGKELTQELPYEVGEQSYKALKQAYKTAKLKTAREYGKIAEFSDEPLKIAADYLKTGVVPEIQNWARKGTNGFGFDLQAPGMENASRLYKQASDFMKFDKITSVNFNKLEQWRGRVSQGISNSTTPAEKAFLSGMLQRFDDAMDVLPKEAIKSGDERMLQQLIKARGARKTQGALFERNKLVANILEKDRITNEEMANMLFGAGKDVPLRLESMIKALGKQKAPEFIASVRQGKYASILKNSLSSELKEGQVAEQMISFDKLATQLGKFVNDNPTVFKQLHPNPADRQAVKQLLEDVSRIKSMKPGTVNYSNTANQILSFLRKISPAATSTNIPFVGSIGGGLGDIATAGAVSDLEKALSPVLQDTIQSLEGPLYNFTEKFGRPALVSATSWSARE